MSDVMEITVAFGNTFADMMRAKWRLFFRRGIWRFAIGSALVSAGLCLTRLNDFSLRNFMLTWLTCFLVVCALAILLQFVAATIQSRRLERRVVTFRENTIHVNYQGQAIETDWNWIISAEDRGEALTLRIQRWPPSELFLSKNRLDATTYQLLHGWLVNHGKLQRERPPA